MTDIGKAYVQIIPSATGISGSISKLLDPEATSAGTSAGTNIASALGKAVTGALGALGIEQFIQKSLEAGGALQQSFGGLKTIYGDAAEQAQKFAYEAAQSGISANDYAEQAVSFGASLKKALGDDTKAMEAANTAILDMTDNAAKMGTPIESIQTAYQGFAKQNYTMLDNLKLGYGGTKTEMERLLADAQKLSGVKYDISNLGDVYKAIHVIQDNLGLVGVAAGEAKTTLTGSFDAAKASLTNFMAALSTGEDIVAPLTAFVQSAGTFLFGNLVPMIWNIVKAIPSVFGTLLQTVVPELSERISTIFQSLPGLFESGLSMVSNIINGIVAALPGIMDKGIEIIVNFVNGILTKMPDLIRTAGDMLAQFMSKIMENFPEIMEKGFELIKKLAEGIMNNLPAIIAAAAEVIAKLVATFYQHLPKILETGIKIILELVAGLIRSIPTIVAAIPQIVDSIRNSFERIDWLSVGINIIAGIARGITSGVGMIIDAAKSAAASAFNAAKNWLGINSPSKVFESQIGKWIPAGIAKGITKNAGVIEEAMSDASGLTLSAFDAAKPSASHVSNKSVTVNVYGAEGQNVIELARMVADLINDEVNGKAAVYA